MKLHHFVVAILLGILPACGGSDSSNQTNNAPIVTTLPNTPTVFPPFTNNRSDYLNANEGTAAQPLVIAKFPNTCIYQPFTEWQRWMCGSVDNIRSVYSVSNSFSNTNNPFYTWRIVTNNEFIQNVDDCLTGPPNQGLDVNVHPYGFSYNESSLKLSIEHRTSNDNCSRVPYMSASYVRGVQGDSTSRIYSWRELTNKTINVMYDLSETQDGGLSWMEVYLHFRDPVTSKRYMIKQDYTTPIGQDIPAGVIINWNWPFVNSFHYPGAQISILPNTHDGSVKSGNSKLLVIDPVQKGLLLNPEFANIEPDFLGIELAIEVYSGPQKTELTLRKVEFVQH